MVVPSASTIPDVPSDVLAEVPVAVPDPVLVQRCPSADWSLLWGGRLNMMAVASPVAAELLGLLGSASIEELGNELADAVGIPTDVGRFVVSRAIAQFQSAGFVLGAENAFAFLEACQWSDAALLPLRLLKRRGFTVGSMLGFPRVETNYEPGSCIEKRLELATDATFVAVRVGDQAFLIRAVDPEHARLLSSGLGSLVSTDSDGLSVALHFVGAGSGSEGRTRHRLYDSLGGLLLMSKDLGRVAEAIGSYVAAGALYSDPSTLVLSTRSVLGPDGIVLVGPPTFRRLAKVERTLNRRGWFLVDHGRALLDRTNGEVIVAAPVDLGVERTLSIRGAAPGRYPLAGFAADGTPAEADNMMVLAQLVSSLPLDVPPDADFMRLLLRLADDAWALLFSREESESELIDLLVASGAPI